MTSTSTSSTARASQERAVGQLLTAKGREARHAALWAALAPLASRAYAHLADKEQWQGTGSPARPLRSPWTQAFAHKDTGKGFALSTVNARAFRALAAFILETANKQADRSPDGLQAWLERAEAVVASITQPAATPRQPAPGAADTALARAVALVTRRAGDLTDAQRQALAGAIGATVQPAPSAALPALPAPAAPLALPAP